MNDPLVWVTGYYNDEANALWRAKHPTSRHPGPQAGELAIQVEGTRDVVDLDRQILEEREDIGTVVMREIGR